MAWICKCSNLLFCHLIGFHCLSGLGFSKCSVNVLFILLGVPQGISRPVIDHTGPTEWHTSIESAPEEGSKEESSLYELVWSTEGHKNPDVGEVDYESDESLDGLIDDLPEQLGKVLYSIINIVGAS